MQISVAQALKEKKRLAGEIAHLWYIFQNENSCLETHIRKVDVKETLQTIELYTDKLVELKTKLSIANQGEHLRNMQLLEANRKKLASLESVSGSEDPMSNSLSGKIIERTAVFSENKLESMRKGVRRKIAVLQDRLDFHNAKTLIDFETPLD